MGRGELAQLITQQRAGRGPAVAQKTPEVEAVVSLLKAYDWRYSADVDYDSYLGDEHEEYCDFICRCSQISNARIRPRGWIGSDNLQEAADAYTDRFESRGITSNSPLTRWWELNSNSDQRAREIYAIERVMTRVTPSEDDFYVSVVGGYYGEEIGDVTLQSDSSWERALTQLGLSSDSDVVEGALKLEYGTLLPRLTGKSWRRELVKLADVYEGNPNRQDMSQEMISAYERRFNPAYSGNSWMSKKRLSRSEELLRSVSAVEIPQGVGVRERSGKIRLIDGYHRIAAAKKALAASPEGLREVSLWLSDQ